MPHLHYLTVQDILWINLQATKKVQHFNYARLEEATFYQYSYGDSTSLEPQAGRFLTGFLKLHPFDAGNESTALVACESFLKINGHGLNLNDDTAKDWLDRVMTKQRSGVDAVNETAAENPDYQPVLQPDVRGAIAFVLSKYAGTLSNLSNRSAVAK
jgi:prophage maintenance system killer protein